MVNKRITFKLTCDVDLSKVDSNKLMEGYFDAMKQFYFEHGLTNARPEVAWEDISQELRGGHDA